MAFGNHHPSDSDPSDFCFEFDLECFSTTETFPSTPFPTPSPSPPPPQTTTSVQPQPPDLATTPLFSSNSLPPSPSKIFPEPSSPSNVVATTSNTQKKPSPDSDISDIPSVTAISSISPMSTGTLGIDLPSPAVADSPHTGVSPNTPPPLLTYHPTNVDSGARRSPPITAIIGGVLGGLLLLSIVLSAFLWRRHRRRHISLITPFEIVQERSLTGGPIDRPISSGYSTGSIKTGPASEATFLELGAQPTLYRSGGQSMSVGGISDSDSISNGSTVYSETRPLMKHGAASYNLLPRSPTTQAGPSSGIGYMPEVPESVESDSINGSVTAPPAYNA